MDADLMSGYLAYSNASDIVTEVQHSCAAENVRVSWFTIVSLTFVTTVDH